MRARALSTLGWLVVMLTVSVPGHAQEMEEILAYDVSIDIARDARLLVTERIQVRALGDEIRRGIYRDFPTSFPRSSGLGRIEAPFQVLSVQRDGAPEHYALESIGGTFGRGGVRVRIGRSDVFLDPGVYDYEIRYETDRWVTFDDDADRLYWNVTGNGWDFPIRSASARVSAEGITEEPALEAWTGPQGSTERNAEMSWEAGSGDAVFRTTSPLGPGEGLTVRVSYPKGLLTPPSEARRAEWFWLDWGGYIDAGYLVLLVMGVYLLMWLRVGRDPPQRATMVRYEPPDDFSPAGLGYLHRRGYHMSQLAAALVSMAVKGAIRIEKTKRKWTLHKVDEGVELSPEERRVFTTLLGRRNEIELVQSNHEKLRKAIKAMKRKLSNQLEKIYFVNNRTWFFIGLTLSVLGFGVLAWRSRFGIEPGAWFVGIWLTGWTAGVTTMLWRAITSLRSGLRGGGFGDLIGGAFMSLFLLPFLAAEIFVGGMFVQMVPTHLVLAAVALGVVNVAFYHLLERPTLKGRGVLDELEGFRTFVEATEEDRFDRMNPPDKTLELFERYLPHAIALGLENRWAERFQGVLTPAAVAASAGGAMHWYDGGGTSMDTSSFASSLGSSLSSTLSSSSSRPGGSGGGGGGSSGGGGGGGGGGGW